MDESELLGDFSGFSGMGADSGGFLSMDQWSKLGDLGIQLLANRSVNANTTQPLMVMPQVSNGGVVPVGFPALGALGSGAARMLGLGAGAGVMAAGAAAVGIIRSAAGRILGWILPSGAKVSRSAAVKLAKEMGLSVAAGAIGATAVDLAEAVMQEEGKRSHRRRGITAAALSTTRRTMGKIERMHRMIVKEARKHHRA